MATGNQTLFGMHILAVTGFRLAESASAILLSASHRRRTVRHWRFWLEDVRIQFTFPRLTECCQSGGHALYLWPRAP